MPTAELTKSLNTVFVTFNYRLGAFGFLALEVLSWLSRTGSSGNYGYQDQVAALKWVHNNIGSFGGSPNKVRVSKYILGVEITYPKNNNNNNI